VFPHGSLLLLILTILCSLKRFPNAEMNSSWSSEDILQLFECYSFVTENQKAVLKEKQYQANQLNRNLLGILNELKIIEKQQRDKILLDWNQISLKQLSPSVFLSQRRLQPSKTETPEKSEKGRPSTFKAYDKALSSRTLSEDVDDDDVIDEIYFFELDEINPPPPSVQLSASNSYNNLSSPRRVAFNGENERFSDNTASNQSISLNPSSKIPSLSNLQVALSPEKSQSNLPSISLESIGKNNSSFGKSSNFFSSSSERQQINELLVTVDELHKVIELSNNEKFGLQQKITDMEEKLSEEKKLLRLSTQEMKAIQNENNSLVDENSKLNDSLLKLRERCDKLMVLQKRTTLLVNSQGGKDRKVLLPSMKEYQELDDQMSLSLIDSIDDSLMMKVIDEFMVEKECQTTISVNPTSDCLIQENPCMNSGSSSPKSPRSILVNGNTHSSSNSNPTLISPRGRRIAFQNEESIGTSPTTYDENDAKLLREKELKIIELEKNRKDLSKQIQTLTDMIDLLQEKVSGVSLQNQQLSSAYSELLTRNQQLEEELTQLRPNSSSAENQSPQQQRSLHRTSPQRNLHRATKLSHNQEEETTDEGARDRSIDNNSEIYYLKYDGHYHYSYQPLNISTEVNPTTNSAFPLSSPVMVSSGNNQYNSNHLSNNFSESPIQQLTKQRHLLSCLSPQQQDYCHDFDSLSSHPEDNHPQQQQQLTETFELNQPMLLDNENENFFITQEKWIRKESVYLANIHYLLELLQELSDAYQRMLKKVALFQKEDLRTNGDEGVSEGEGSLLRQHWFRSSTQQLINSFSLIYETESQTLEEEENRKKTHEQTLARLLESNYRFLQKQQQLLTLQNEQGTYLPLPSPTAHSSDDSNQNQERIPSGVSKSKKELCPINNEKYFNLLKEHYKVAHLESSSSPRSFSSSYLYSAQHQRGKSPKRHYLIDTCSTQQRFTSKQRPLGGYKHPVAALKPYITLVQPQIPTSSSEPASPTAREAQQLPVNSNIAYCKAVSQPNLPKRPKSANNAIRPSSAKSSSSRNNGNHHRKLVGY
jgi:hypothetical protein